MLLEVLALSDKKIKAGETVPVEEVLVEFSVEAMIADGRRNLASLLARRLPGA
jgi:hypothetical protein